MRGRKYEAILCGTRPGTLYLQRVLCKLTWHSLDSCSSRSSRSDGATPDVVGAQKPAMILLAVSDRMMRRLCIHFSCPMPLACEVVVLWPEMIELACHFKRAPSPARPLGPARQSRECTLPPLSSEAAHLFSCKVCWRRQLEVAKAATQRRNKASPWACTYELNASAHLGGARSVSLVCLMGSWSMSPAEPRDELSRLAGGRPHSNVD